MAKTQDRSKTIGSYSFDEETHKHTLDGKPLSGVTTVLSVIAKPALIQWSANMAVEYIKLNSLKGNLGYNVTLEKLEEAKFAHKKKKEKAGDWGSEVHSAIETWIQTQSEEYDERIIPFVAWAKENKVKFLESEKNVFSRELWLGGILDLVIELGGKRLIADIKTSSGIYNEHFFQMAAYDLCLEEMGEPKVDGYLVLNLKKTGEFDLKISYEKDINREAFKSALSLYKIINSLK